MPYTKPTKLGAAEMDTLCKVVHEALRTYGSAIGQKPMPAWSRSPEWMKAATLESVQSVLDDPNQKPGTQHQQWMDKKKQDGWQLGKTKDGRRKTHPMLVPFSELPDDERAKDALLIAIVRALSGFA